MQSQRWLVKALCGAVVLGLLSVIGTVQAGAVPDTADAFIKRVGKQAIDSLTATNLPDSEREKRFREILEDTFDVKLIARFTLGRYWRRASEEQRKEYVHLFEDFIVQAYAARFKNYAGERFEVGQVRDINDQDQLVQSDIVLQDGRKIPVHWRVRGEKQMYRIVDVVVEGVSMAITQRDEFSSIINQHGGKVDGLLVALRKKTGKD